MADVVLPQLGESVVEGTILRWLKAVGDVVAVDDVLFEVSTDKVDSEVPSDVAGVLVEVVVGEGETVSVGSVVAVVDTEAAGGEPAAELVVPEPAAPKPVAPEPAEVVSAPLVSPLGRRIAREKGVDLAEVVGSGDGGRVTRLDVERHARGAVAGTSSQKIERYPAAAPASGARPDSGGELDGFVPFAPVRRRTGDHMVASLVTSPHAVTAVEVFYDNVERVRARHGERFRDTEGFSLTYLPFIARATVDALAEFPHLNASVAADGSGLVLHRHVNLSVAVDLNFEGLVAPVIRNAEELRLLGVARAIRDVATRARTKKLSPDDLVGGTFTLSNSGGYGTHMVIPIINQPQVGIISTDGVARKPAVVDDGAGEAIAIRSVGVLAMSWDHRAFDGAYAAAFMAKIKNVLEARDWEGEL